MAEEKKKEVKMPKKSEKFVWLIASVIVAIIGTILHLAEIKFPTVVNIFYSAGLMFTIIMCAQKISIERFSYTGENPNKKMYFIKSVVYYLVIILSIFYVFLLLWITGILSV